MKWTEQDFMEGKVAVRGDGSHAMKCWLYSLQKANWHAEAQFAYFYTNGEIIGKPVIGCKNLVEFSDLTPEPEPSTNSIQKIDPNQPASMLTVRGQIAALFMAAFAQDTQLTSGPLSLFAKTSVEAADALIAELNK